MWREYTEGKQTYEQLAVRYECSIRTIQRRLDKVEVKGCESDRESKPGLVVIVIDTTYFGRVFGVLLIVNAHTGKMLHREYVRYETNELYERCVNGLKEQGYDIAAIVCDGRTALRHKTRADAARTYVLANYQWDVTLRPLLDLLIRNETNLEPQ